MSYSSCHAYEVEAEVCHTKNTTGSLRDRITEVIIAPSLGSAKEIFKTRHIERNHIKDIEFLKVSRFRKLLDQVDYKSKLSVSMSEY